MEYGSSRNYNLDLLKMFACLGVVTGHVGNVHGVFAGTVAALGTIACPCFFMISGYFSKSYGVKENQMKRKMLHFCGYFFIGVLLAGAFDLIIGKSFVGDYDTICSFFLYNVCRFFSTAQPLWYLAAMIYIYLVGYMLAISVGHCFCVRCQVVIAAVLILVELGLEYCHVIGILGDNYYYRNFLFEGLPYFLIGKIIKQKQGWLENISVIKNIMLIVCGGG